MTKRSVEKQIVVKLSSRTETTQPLLSYELCRKLRDEGFDGTADSADATAITAGLDRLSVQSVCEKLQSRKSWSSRGIFDVAWTNSDRTWPISGSHFYFIEIF